MYEIKTTISNIMPGGFDALSAKQSIDKFQEDHPEISHITYSPFHSTVVLYFTDDEDALMFKLKYDADTTI